MGEHLLGIRHHGPGSARSVSCALDQIQPDVILVEGPADAESLLPLATHEDMQPPVAILMFAVDDPSSALYYPFAAFSPEWIAIRYARKHNIPLRMLDLPASTTLALELRPKGPGGVPPLFIPDNDELEAAAEASELRTDPMLALARAAGYEDSERWWEHMVEDRRDGAPLFEAVAEAMTALRMRVEAELKPAGEDRRELMREAHMRRVLRRARKDGFERIAVVCGAWHVPALQALPPESHDRRWLTKLPKRKVSATWIPWSHGRLTFASGYGAGVNSPGWYHHLFTHRDNVAIRWLNRIAAHLREQGIDVSSAQVIDAVRLADALAAMRDRPAAGLSELHEAAESVLLAAETLPWTLIHKQVVVGERIGQVPAETPMVPLQRDLSQLQKKLRLRPDDGDRELVLDLRKDIDLQRSFLLRRLQLLDIPWGQGGERGEGTGTFKETWELGWDPEFALQVIEASPHGATVEAAATSLALDRARKASSLPVLTELVRGVVLAHLPQAIPGVVARMQNEAAVASDLTHLMRALPDLVHLIRYGDVRGTQAEPVAKVVDGLVARVCVGLPAACTAIREDAAQPLFEGVVAMQAALSLLDRGEHTALWHEALLRVTDDPQTTPLLQGRACRLALEANRLSTREAAARLSLHLSRVESPPRAAAWLDGFLRGSGQVLVYDDSLWSLVDEWLDGLRDDVFLQLLPLLRRTFSSFTEPERRAMGERSRAEARSTVRVAQAGDADDVDSALGVRALPLIRRLLGLGETA
jgi:Family of unknown function (DUF5682)